MQFFATEGKLSLEDPITKYFPTLHIPGIPDECVCDLRMLQCTGPAFRRWSLWNGRLRKNSRERDDDWFRQMAAEAPNQMDQIGQIVDYISAGNYEPLGMPGSI